MNLPLPRFLSEDQSRIVERFIRDAERFDIITFCEFHNLKFCLGWYAVNILPRLPSIGISDWVSEIFTVDIGNDRKNIIHTLEEFPFETFRKTTLESDISAYRLRVKEELGFDIGFERALREYFFFCKTLWLRKKLEQGSLPSLKQNYAIVGKRDDVLLSLIIAVENGINFHGSMTTDVFPHGRESLYESYVKIMELGKKKIGELRKQRKKVAGYFGVPHGMVKESGSILFKPEELGKNWFSKHSDLSSIVTSVTFRDVSFSFATELVQKTRNTCKLYFSLEQKKT